MTRACRRPRPRTAIQTVPLSSGKTSPRNKTPFFSLVNKNKNLPLRTILRWLISNSHTVGPSKDLKQVTTGCRGNCSSLQLHSASFPPRGQPAVSAGICNPKSGECVINVTAMFFSSFTSERRPCLNLKFTVLSRTFTCEELLAPGAPFIKKVLTVRLLQLGNMWSNMWNNWKWNEQKSSFYCLSPSHRSSEMCWAGALWSGVRPLVTCRPLTLEAQQQPLGWRWAHPEVRHQQTGEHNYYPPYITVFRCDTLCAKSMDSVSCTWITELCPEWWWQERVLLCWRFWNHWNDSCYNKNNRIWVLLLFICLFIYGRFYVFIFDN